jgi:hypothetical protein
MASTSWWSIDFPAGGKKCFGYVWNRFKDDGLVDSGNGAARDGGGVESETALAVDSSNGAAMDGGGVDDVAFASMLEQQQRLQSRAIDVAESMDRKWTERLREISFRDFVLHAQFPESFVESISDLDFWDSCKEKEVYEYLDKRGRSGIVLYYNVELVSTDLYSDDHAHGEIDTATSESTGTSSCAPCLAPDIERVLVRRRRSLQENIRSILYYWAT